MEIVTRFAPSPTGWLHLGSAHAALFAFSRARAAGGRFLLRLEDIDAQRCRAEYAEGILRDLEWLGVEWDGAVRRQSAHRAEYDADIAALAGRGLAYPCFCSRADIAAAGSAPHGPDGPIYPGTCRGLSSAERGRRRGEAHAWRLDVGAALREVFVPGADAYGDVVIGRRDAIGSYHLCVTHDDAVQGVTLVTRGVDLLPAVALHELLQRVMGWAVPGYAHHPLLVDATGRRLSKRDRAVGIGVLREGGASAEEVRGMAGFAEDLLGG